MWVSVIVWMRTPKSYSSSALSFDVQNFVLTNWMVLLSSELPIVFNFQIQENAHPSNSCFVRNYNLNTGQPGITWALDNKYYPTTLSTKRTPMCKSKSILVILDPIAISEFFWMRLLGKRAHRFYFLPAARLVKTCAKGPREGTRGRLAFGKPQFIWNLFKTSDPSEWLDDLLFWPVWAVWPVQPDRPVWLVPGRVAGLVSESLKHLLGTS